MKEKGSFDEYMSATSLLKVVKYLRKKGWLQLGWNTKSLKKLEYSKWTPDKMTIPVKMYDC